MSVRTSCAGDCGSATREAPDPETLLRPEFFCGQLLTDADMTALTAWVRARMRLTAERTGWGVVCGLTAVSDVQPPYRLILQPGVAVSPCGQDILVASDVRVDLSGAVPGLGVPCDRPAQNYKKDQTTAPTDCVVDVGVRYREEGRVPVLGVGRGDCAPPANCIDSRVAEGYEIVCEPVVDPRVNRDDGWTGWKDGYDGVVALLDKAAGVFAGDATNAAEWLKDRWRETTRTRFPWLGDQIDRWNQSEAGFAELLFWVTQDGILGYLETSCLPACPSTGCGCGCGSCAPTVPLARVWLHNEENRWVVIAIDDQPPFRRLLSDERPGQPEGGVNLGHVIWRDRKDAARLVRRAGVNVSLMEWKPVDIAGVRALLSLPPATIDDDVILRYVNVPSWAGIGGLRAVGFGADPVRQIKTPVTGPPAKKTTGLPGKKTTTSSRRGTS